MARACVAATTLGSRLYVLGGKDTWGKETTGVSACATGVALFVSGCVLGGLLSLDDV